MFEELNLGVTVRSILKEYFWLLLLLIASAGVTYGQDRAMQQPMPDLWLKDVNGSKVNVGALRGKVVFVNFWAMSCIPCREEMPSIDSMKHALSADSNVIVISADLGNDSKAALAYFTEHGLHLDEYTAAGVLPEACFRGVLPTTLVVDKRGKMVFFKEEQYHYNTPEFLGMMRKWLGE